MQYTWKITDRTYQLQLQGIAQIYPVAQRGNRWFALINALVAAGFSVPEKYLNYRSYPFIRVSHREEFAMLLITLQGLPENFIVELETVTEEV